MKKEELSVLSNVIIALSTFIGVGGATAYYMKEIQGSSLINIVLTEIIYVTLALVLIIWIMERLE